MFLKRCPKHAVTAQPFLSVLTIFPSKARKPPPPNHFVHCASFASEEAAGAPPCTSAPKMDVHVFEFCEILNLQVRIIWNQRKAKKIQTL
jgi:hypothetical protein